MVLHLKKYDEGALCISSSGEGQMAVGGADGSIKLLQQGEWKQPSLTRLSD